MDHQNAEHAAAINHSFATQAANFESPSMSFSKQEFLDYTVRAIGLGGSERVLEVAAGTCATGRAIAPFAAEVTCLDITPQMLEVGKEKAREEGLSNMRFVVGDAEQIPFPDGSFDVAVSRLAFHHMLHPERVFAQMRRVLAPGGKLVLIDMEAAAPDLRETEDAIERMRDISHVRNLSREEMLGLFRGAGLAVTKCEATRIPVQLSAWMRLTQTPQKMCNQITALMEGDIAGDKATGFAPYLRDGSIWFDQRWVLVVGEC